MSNSLARTIKNIYKSGFRRAAWQIQFLNDTKSGDLVGQDDFGNKYYETKDPAEIHLRNRWVEYKDGWNLDMSHVEPGWHYWLGYGTDTIPTKLEGKEKTTRGYPLPPVHKIQMTNTSGAYVPYNTAKPKFATWDPQVAERGPV